MHFDLDFRYRRALAPEGLSIIQTAVQAVEDAIKSGREITYRRSRHEHDELGGPTHYADIGCLADIPKFALRTEHDLAMIDNRDQARLTGD